MRALFFFFTAIFLQFSYAKEYHVNVNGADDVGDGSLRKPWRTIGHALRKVNSGEGHAICISEGTFFEHSTLLVPPGISIIGAGRGATVIKGTPQLYYNPLNPGFEPGRFLLRLDGPLQTRGDQKLSGFTIDGSSKQIHGGIYINGRTNIIIEDVNVQETNFCGIWIMNSADVRIRRISLKNCAWGGNEWCSGALQFAYVDHFEIDDLNIDEGTGYGIKTLGHNKAHLLRNFKLHDSRVSVTPKGLWKNGKAPNIAVEIWANSFEDSEIYNCYFDNHISIVNSDHSTKSTGQRFRIHHNTFDIQSRAKGKGYGIELTIHDAEVDHNFFNGGYSGISNWTHAKKNWRIHHNIFYGISSPYPTAVINAYKGNLNDVHIYNNTVELAGTSTVNFLQCDNGGISEDVVIRNNLIINSNKAYSHYPNRFISLENGARITNLVVENNLLHNLDLIAPAGVIRNNICADPKIKATGPRPYPYYLPDSKSPLIDGGTYIRRASESEHCGIGAYESAELSKSFFAD